MGAAQTTPVVAAGDRLLTAEEAAARLGTGLRFARRLISERRILFVHVGRSVRIPASAVDQFIADGAVLPARPATVPEPRRATPRPRSEKEPRMAGRRRFGSLRQLPSGRWQASYVAPDSARHTAPSTFATKTAAADWLVDIQSSVLGERWLDPTPGNEPLGPFLRRWIVERGLRPRTADLYNWLANKRIEPVLGALPLNKITPARVRTWYADLLAEGVSADGVAKAYRLLRSVFNTAVADGALARNPCQIKGGGIYKTPERPVINLAQVVELEQLFPAQLRAMVTLATFGSLRYGEVIGLRRYDIDVEARTVHVHEQINERSTGEMITGPPKSAAGTRRVALPSVAMRTLEAHLAEHVDAAPDALLFTNSVGGPIRRTGFNKACGWSAAVAAIGVPHLHFNDLRHTGNTIAAGTPGTSLRDLMHRMGQSTMRAALIYQHVNRESDRRIADAFDLKLNALGLVHSACSNERFVGASDGASSGASAPDSLGEAVSTKAHK